MSDGRFVATIHSSDEHPIPGQFVIGHRTAISHGLLTDEGMTPTELARVIADSWLPDMAGTIATYRNIHGSRED